MLEYSEQYSATITKWRESNDARYAEHKAVLLLSMVCFQSDQYRSGAKAVQQALSLLESADELALSVFNLNHQISMFKGTKLLRDTCLPISREFHAANARVYAGLQAIFDALGINLESYEASPILDELKYRSESVIMNYIIFN